MSKLFLFICILIGVALAALTTYLLMPENCEGPVTCTSDKQCGGTIVHERFCRDGNVYGNGQANVCQHKDTCNAVCETTYGTVLVEPCSNGCEAGACL